MIGKPQVTKIVFVKNNISKPRPFQEDLLDKLEGLCCGKISRIQFNQWLDSWVATAELDMDKNAAARIRKSVLEIKCKKTPYATWTDFKRSVGL